jgi:hypothetical protein
LRALAVVLLAIKPRDVFRAAATGIPAEAND